MSFSFPIQLRCEKTGRLFQAMLTLPNIACPHCEQEANAPETYSHSVWSDEMDILAVRGLLSTKRPTSGEPRIM